MHIGKYAILKASKYEFEVLQGKVISPEEFVCSFNLQEFNSFFDLPEINELESIYAQN